MMPFTISWTWLRPVEMDWFWSSNLSVRVSGQQYSILLQCLWSIIRSNSKDRRKRELQLLASHGLETHGEIEGRDRDFPNLLARDAEELLGDFDILDVGTCDS